MFMVKDFYVRRAGRGRGLARRVTGVTTWVAWLVGSAAWLTRTRGAAPTAAAGRNGVFCSESSTAPSVTFNTDDTNTLSGTWLASSTGRYRCGSWNDFLQFSQVFLVLLKFFGGIGGSGWPVGLELCTCFAARARRRDQRVGESLPMSVF